MPVENMRQKKFITYTATEKSRCDDGEIKYLRQNPCGKYDVNKYLELVQDKEIEVRCHNL